MKIQKNIWLVGLIFLGVGLFLGWLFFKSEDQTSPEQTHQHEGKETIWTCSMHPQIRQSEPGNCPICGMELIPLDNSASEDPQALEMTPAAMQLANVQTTEVREAQAVKEILLNGRIKADETRVYSQVAHIPGRIERLYIDYTGKYVKAGEKLAEVYSPELVTAQEELLEAKKYADSNPALLEAARNKLKLWKLSDAQVRAIEESGRVRSNLPIRADVSGYVMEKNVNLGDHLKQGEVMFQIADLSEVWAMFEAYESDISWIKEGDKIRFTVTSLPGETFEASINYIDPVIDPAKRVAMVRAEVNNRKQRLKPEMFARGKVLSSLDQQHKGLIIPETAVMWTGKRSVVYLKDPQKEVPTFRMQEVLLGEKVGEYYLVEEGVQQGDLVVSNGTFSIDAAAQLKNLPSMMNPDAGQKQAGMDKQEKADAPEAFQNQLAALYHAYLKLNEALIASDATKARQNVKDMQAALKGINMALLKGKAHDEWMKQMQQISQSLKKMAAAEGLETQRSEYAKLSQAMHQSVATFGVNETVYYQYCPMANSNQGAFWLSDQEEIRNPYYGESMLGCGETREVIED
jgi:membrane fusion protein, copper/silver efflux system